MHTNFTAWQGQSKNIIYDHAWQDQNKQTNMWTLLWFNLGSTRPSICVVGAMQGSWKFWGPSFGHKKLFHHGPKLWGHKYGHYGIWQLDSKNRWTSLSRLMGATGFNSMAYFRVSEGTWWASPNFGTTKSQYKLINTHTIPLSSIVGNICSYSN